MRVVSSRLVPVLAVAAATAALAAAAYEAPRSFKAARGWTVVERLPATSEATRSRS